jgi:hypothetical protein
VYCVALCSLAASSQPVEALVAELLGMTVYDARLRVTGTLPRIVGYFDTQLRATDIAQTLNANGHSALVFNGQAALPLDALPLLRRFAVRGEHLYSNDQAPTVQPLGALLALIAIVVSAGVERTTKETVSRPTGRGAYVQEIKTRTRTERAHEQIVLLAFRDGPPRFLALGARLRPTAHENMQATIAWLRELAPNCVYDTRFVETPLAAGRSMLVIGEGAAGPLGVAKDTDCVLHALQLWLTRPRQLPYR